MASESPSSGLAGEAQRPLDEAGELAAQAAAKPGSPTNGLAPPEADELGSQQDPGAEGSPVGCGRADPAGSSTEEPAAAGPEESSRCRLLLLVREDGTVAASIQPGEEAATADAGQPTPSTPAGSLPVEQAAAAATAAIEASVSEGGSPAAASEEDAAQLEQFKVLQEERATLLEENAMLQHLAREHIDRGSKASKQSWQDASNMAGIEQRYAIGLQQLQKLVAQRATAAVRVEAALVPGKERLAAAQARADAHRQAFHSLVGQVAQGSKKNAGAGPGKGDVSDKALKAFVEADPLKVAEVQLLRLRNAHLQHRIAIVEQQLKDSKQLSEGLHLIDFEQLKIENSTLSYKIEARSAEVLKLQTKLTQTIQMAAHAKEKLHCMAQEKRCLESKLSDTEAQLQQSKVELAAAKARREQLESAQAKLKKDWQIITDRRCLADLAAQKAKLAELQVEQARLKQAYEAIS